MIRLKGTLMRQKLEEVLSLGRECTSSGKNSPSQEDEEDRNQAQISLREGS